MSVVSVWEIGIEIGLRKLTLPLPIANFVVELVDRTSYWWLLPAIALFGVSSVVLMMNTVDVVSKLSSGGQDEPGSSPPASSVRPGSIGR